MNTEETFLDRMKASIRAEIAEFCPLVPRTLVNILPMTPENTSERDLEAARMDWFRLSGKAADKVRAIEIGAATGRFQPTPETADLPDEFIIKAVQFMCSRDEDLAGKKNRVGWSQADSGKGHVGNMLIKSGRVDRAGIIGRHIIGRYLKTQLAHMRGKVDA